MGAAQADGANGVATHRVDETVPTTVDDTVGPRAGLRLPVAWRIASHFDIARTSERYSMFGDVLPVLIRIELNHLRITINGKFITEIRYRSV
jgi:hypothetical protein